jgi:site-specific DNA recombinase
VWSAEQMHEPLVSFEDCAAVQGQMLAAIHRPTPTKGHSTARHYLLSGRVRCSMCGRRMQGTWAHEAARYRCKFPAEYALANKLDHPKSAYVRESAIVPKLDEWSAQLFDTAHLDETCEALAMAASTTKPQRRGQRQPAARLLTVTHDWQSTARHPTLAQTPGW